MSNDIYTYDKLAVAAQKVLQRPYPIDKDVYVSVLLSLIGEENIIFNNANKDLVDIYVKQIMNRFTKRKW